MAGVGPVKDPELLSGRTAKLGNSARSILREGMLPLWALLSIRAEAISRVRLNLG